MMCLLHENHPSIKYFIILTNSNSFVFGTLLFVKRFCKRLMNQLILTAGYWYWYSPTNNLGIKIKTKLPLTWHLRYYDSTLKDTVACMMYCKCAWAVSQKQFARNSLLAYLFLENRCAPVSLTNLNSHLFRFCSKSEQCQCQCATDAFHSPSPSPGCSADLFLQLPFPSYW